MRRHLNSPRTTAPEPPKRAGWETDSASQEAGDTRPGDRGPSPWWREGAMVVALGVKVLLVVLVVQYGRREASVDSLPVASPAPDFAIESTTGDILSLGAFRGRPVVLVFWATWCGACRDDLPDLERLSRESGDDFAVVMVSREPVTRLARFAAERRLSVAMGSDRGGRAFSAYGVESLPMTVIVDANGRVAADFIGRTSYEALRGRIDRLR